MTRQQMGIGLIGIGLLLLFPGFRRDAVMLLSIAAMLGGFVLVILPEKGD